MLRSIGPVGVCVGVDVGVCVTVCVRVTVDVLVCVGVFIGVDGIVGVTVGSSVSVTVGVCVNDGVCVDVGVKVGVSLAFGSVRGCSCIRKTCATSTMVFRIGAVKSSANSGATMLELLPEPLPQLAHVSGTPFSVVVLDPCACGPSPLIQSLMTVLVAVAVVNAVAIAGEAE